MATRRSEGLLVAFAVLLIVGSMYVGRAAGAATITAYKSTIPVNIGSPYQASQWVDTPTINEPTSGMTFAVKQNGTGWLFLMIWPQSAGVCDDAACYGGIELGHLNNTAVMGSPTTPTIMILGSQLFQGMVGHTVDEFISEGTQTPTSVESDGYDTQSVCGPLAVTSTTYTVQCYRPFELTKASPYDFPGLGVGSTIEIGFAVGDFSNPGDHDATTMSDYVLTFSGSTYSGSTATTTTTSTPTTSTTSTSARTTTTTTSTTSTTSTTRTSTTSTPTTSITTTTPTTTSSTTTTAPTSTSTSTASTSRTTTSSATTTPAYAVVVAANAKSYSGSTPGTISGTVTGPASPGGTVQVQITSPSNAEVFTDVVPAPSGRFNASFTPGAGWTAPGTYTLTASYCPDIYAPFPSYFVADFQFSYTPAAATTTAASSGTASTTTTTSTSGAVAPAGTNAATYAEELAVLVVGFSVLIALVLARYGRR